MKEVHSNSSYAILPSFIMDDDSLSEGAKVLYARISMYSEDGRCWATNEHFALKQKVTIRCIQNWLKQLSDAGYIEIELHLNPDKGTTRDIWIKIDFKENYKKRNSIHPPPRTDVHGEPERTFTHININNTNKDREYKAHGLFVKFLEEDYQKLCSQHGKNLVDQIIQSINDHCTNNRPEGYPDYLAAYRTFFVNYKKSKGGQYANKRSPKSNNQRKFNKGQSSQEGGEFLNGVRIT